MDVFMSDSDAFSWYMEQDPVLRSTVVVVAWLEKSPDWETLCLKLEEATRRVPVFRMRVLEAPGRVCTPRWAAADRFDLGWHLRRLQAPHTKTRAAVIECARDEAMSAFEPSRPLWRFTLIENLESGRAAFVMKFHHSLTDGIGGMQLALLLFDTDRSAPAPAVLSELPDQGRLDTAGLVAQIVARRLGCLGRAWGAAGRSSVPLLLRSVLHPLETTTETVDTMLSIGRTVAPLRRPLSPIMRGRALSRHLDIVEVQLEDLKRAAAAAGGTVNDGFMAAVSQGLRRYHDRHRSPVDALRVTLPISLRTPEDPPGGNRITLIRFPVPVSRDIKTRLRDIHRLCLAARSEPSLKFTNTIAAALNLLPAGFVGGMLKNVDFLASDVPGFAFPVYLGGALVERYTAFGPTIGASVNATLLSYDGTCSVGITQDTAAIEDPDLLAQCLREGFEDVLELGGNHRPPRLPLHEADTAPQPVVRAASTP